MMRNLTKESTSTFFFSEVMKRSGSSASRVRMRTSKKRTLSSSGTLKYRPGSRITFTGSPSRNTMAFWR